MEENLIPLTNDERQFLKEMLRKVPLQGTVDTLPTILMLVVQILNKLESGTGNTPPPSV